MGESNTCLSIDAGPGSYELAELVKKLFFGKAPRVASEAQFNPSSEHRAKKTTANLKKCGCATKLIHSRKALTREAAGRPTETCNYGGEIC